MENVNYIEDMKKLMGEVKELKETIKAGQEKKIKEKTPEVKETKTPEVKKTKTPEVKVEVNDELKKAVEDLKQVKAELEEIKKINKDQFESKIDLEKQNEKTKAVEILQEII